MKNEGIELKVLRADMVEGAVDAALEQGEVSLYFVAVHAVLADVLTIAVVHGLVGGERLGSLGVSLVLAPFLAETDKVLRTNYQSIPLAHLPRVLALQTS